MQFRKFESTESTFCESVSKLKPESEQIEQQRFRETKTKIPLLPYFQTLQIIEYGPLTFFSPILHENIRFYVLENKKNSN